MDYNSSGGTTDDANASQSNRVKRDTAHGALTANDINNESLACRSFKGTDGTPDKCDQEDVPKLSPASQDQVT